RRLDQLTAVVFDTETTGLEPSAGDRLVQIAGQRVVHGRLREGDVFDTLVDPGRPIPAASTAIHHITNEMVVDAPDEGNAVRAFHAFAEGAVLVAHNAAFDLAFLSKVEGQSGVRFDQPVLDTVLLSAIAFPHESDHTLDGLAARLGVTIPEPLRHTALGDSVATADVFLRLIPLLEGQGIETLSDAIEASDKMLAIRRQQAKY
ncbi:MAG: PolC-type DNA polymerase III, partial [Rubricella sp.]